MEIGKNDWEVEDQIIDHQRDLILQRYGSLVVDRANYAWAIRAGDDYLILSTKVYGPAVVLTTTWRDGKMIDDWADL